MTALPPLLLVSDSRRFPRDFHQVVRRATRDGLRWLQLREPGWSPELRRSELAQLRRWFPELELSLNGDAAMAAELGVGLHMAQAAPRPSSPARPYGRSAHDDAAVRRAIDEGVDYLVFGTVYPTSSKPGRAGCGLESLAAACKLARGIPVYAIGGITSERVPEVLGAGADGVAVCGAILGADDPREATRALAEALESSKEARHGTV